MSLTTPETVTRNLGEDGEACYVGIALLGTNASKRRYLAILSTTSEVELWLESHVGTYVDPVYWRAVIVSSHRGRFQADMRYICAEDWNSGVRWDALR